MDGALWAWGNNSNGVLGLGDTDDRSSPVRIGLTSDWEAVYSSQYYTLAIKTNGSLWSWGSNWNGYLGHGDFVDKSSPVQIGSDSEWYEAYTTDYSAYAFKN